jgi:hypothetical protein
MSTIISVITVGDPEDGDVRYTYGSKDRLYELGWRKDHLHELLEACPKVVVIDFSGEGALSA